MARNPAPGTQGTVTTQEPVHALRPDAHRGRIPRRVRVRQYPQQALGKLDRRPVDRQPRPHRSRPDPALRRASRQRPAAGADRRGRTRPAPRGRADHRRRGGCSVHHRTALLGPDDGLVVVRPNYATNLETPRAIGCEINFVDLVFEEGFALDFDRLAAAITPRTKLISVTCPHNPTGVMMSEA